MKKNKQAALVFLVGALASASSYAGELVPKT